MKYRTRFQNYLLEIMPDENKTANPGTYIIHQCNNNFEHIVGWGNFQNAMQALKHFKEFVVKSRS